MSTSGLDRIAFRGRTRIVLNHALEPYLRRLPHRPDFRLTGPDYIRGYMAQWEVRVDDTLWLTSLKTRPDEDGQEPGLRSVFPTAIGPVAATWVSQSLVTVDGQQRYSPFGSAAIYPHETNLAVWDGRVVMIEIADVRLKQITSTEFTLHLEAIFGPEEGAFLRTIRGMPEDTAPRLVYADWLDERHDPRGTVIRLADRLRGLTPDAMASERARCRDLIGRGLSHWLWTDIMGYRSLVNSDISRIF
jgi:uncharacterized protein (TIGR02996 family)